MPPATINRLCLTQLGEGLKVLDENGAYRHIREKWLGVYEQAAAPFSRVLRNLALALAPFLALLLLIVVWSWSLRRQVVRQTKQLQESEMFQSALIACSPVALCSIDFDGKVQMWNESAEGIFGWTADEVLGQPLPTVPESKQSEFAHINRRVMAGETLIDLEVVLQRKGGTLFEGSLSVAPIHAGAGRIIGTMGAIEDITDRKKTERFLRKSEKRFRSLVEGAPDAIFIQTNGRFAYVNQAFVALMKAESADAILGTPILERFHPDHHEQVRQRILRLNKERQAVPAVDEGMIALDGEVIPVEMAAVPFDFEGHQGALVFARDIRERIQAQKDIDASEIQYRLLADNTLDVIWTMDPDLVFTYVNPAIQALTGHTPEAWAGSRLSDHCDEAHFLEMAAIIQTEIEKGDERYGVVFETEILRRDGSPVLVEIHGKVFFDEQGAISGLQGIARDITQRKQTERALRNSEVLFERVFEFLPIGLWLADKEGRILRGNPAGVQIWGAEPQVNPEGYGVFKAWRLPSREAIGPEDWSMVHTVREGIVVTNELLEIEAFDGRRKFILNSTAPLRDDNGDIAAAVAVNLDVTGRIQVEEALAGSESRLRALVDAIPDLVWLKDPGGVYMSCNPSFERFFGAKEADIVGKTDYDFVDKDLADFFREHDQKAMAADRPRMNEERLIFADGSYQGDFETIKTPMRNSKGDLIGVLGIARDVTQRKAAEKALRENEQRYKSAQKMGRVGNWEYDIQAETFWGSDEAMKMYGFELQTDDFTVDEIESCIPERERVHQALVDLINREKPYDIEFAIHPVDGSPPKIVRSIARLEGDAEGSSPKIMGVLQDITRQKEEEKEKLRLENQLHRSQRMESVGRLAGGVAHDFNNILSVILGYAQLAVEEVGPADPLHGDLTEIVHAAQRSRGITRQLLAFARKETIAPEVLDLNETVESMLKMLRRLIGEDIDLTWRPAPELWPIKMDPSQVDQILANLCVNARDAIQDVGKVTIETKNISIDAA